MARSPKIQLDAIIKRLKKQLKTAAKIPTSSTARKLGKIVVKEMKNNISKGISPIQGKGRFPGYKRAGDKDGYPNTVRRQFPAKRRRPVNLKLSGAFLRMLRGKPKKVGRAFSPNVGFFDNLSRKKESGHRDGVNGQPKRAIIPVGGESLKKSILIRVEKAFKAAILKVVRKFK